MAPDNMYRKLHTDMLITVLFTPTGGEVITALPQFTCWLVTGYQRLVMDW